MAVDYDTDETYNWGSRNYEKIQWSVNYILQLFWPKHAIRVLHPNLVALDGIRIRSDYFNSETNHSSRAV
jgi:hypothetical protein